MRRTLAALLLSAAPLAAAAQDISVRTGEHGDFTRMVVDFADRPGWELTPGPGVWRLTTPGTASFDLSQVHDRIGRDRIADITQPAPGQIDIRVGCDCAPRAFELASGGLVVDVMAADDDRADASFAASGGPPASSGQPSARLIRQVMARPPLPGPGTAPQRAPVPPEPQAPDRARDLREDILAGLSRSADQGLVDLRRPLPGSAPDRPAGAGTGAGSHMRVETQVDRDRDGASATPPASCPAGLSGDGAAWRDALREVDLDQPAAEVARAEAMGLVVRGLGTEAGTLLRPHLDAGGDISLLNEIAGVVDAPAPAPGLAPVAGCSELLSLFALIADPPVAPERIATIPGALAGFDGALRVQFGRRAIAALRGLGRDEDARIVENALLRLDPELTAADLELRRFTPDTPPASEAEARAELSERSPEAAAALGSLIEGMRDRGEEVPADVLDHAAALAPELAPGERTALVASIVRAEIDRRSLQSASARIDALSRLDSQAADALEGELYAALAALPQDSVFLQQASRFADRPAPGEAQRLAIARRIAALHVPDLARAHLAQGDEAREGERRLAARLWLDSDEPDRALAALDGIEGPEAEEIRAEARARSAPAPEPEPPVPATTGPRDVIERSAALREKYRALLGER